MTLQDILAAKGSAVYWIEPQATLAEVAQKLVEHRVGALLVCTRDEEGQLQLKGIVTERDILYYCARQKVDLHATKVTEVMSSPVITGSPSDSVEQIMGLMTTKRIRHLPVIDQGKLAGVVSIGDVVKAQHALLAVENRFMKDYIRG
jgi:CBS domain-containing protein